MTRILKKDLIKRIAYLESELRELVLNPNSFDSMVIKSRITLQNELEKAIMFGHGSITTTDSIAINKGVAAYCEELKNKIKENESK
jgi:hypothetical protein